MCLTESSKQPNEVSVLIMPPILQMQKVWFREGKELAQNHTAKPRQALLTAELVIDNDLALFLMLGEVERVQTA